MQTNISKGFEKIFCELNKLNAFTKTVIKHGAQIFLALLALGTLLIVYNHTVHGLDSYFEFISTSIIKSSFVILAEVVIGGLLIDYIFKKA